MIAKIIACRDLAGERRRHCDGVGNAADAARVWGVAQWIADGRQTSDHQIVNGAVMRAIGDHGAIREYDKFRSKLRQDVSNK